MSTHVNDAASLVRRGAEPGVYIWSFPGAPIEVHIKLDVVDRVRLQISATHPQPGGVLLGRVQGPLIHIHSAKPLATLDNASIEAVLKEESVNRSTVVGYYRVDSAEVLRLSAYDAELAQRYFPSPSSIILLIRPGNTGVPTAGVFFWDAGQLFGDFALLEFPFDSALLAMEHRQKTRSEPTLGSIDRSVTDADDSGRGDPPHAGWPLRKIATWSGAALATALLSAGAVWMLAKWNVGRHQPANPPANAAAQPRPKIDLRAERTGQDFRLTWDANSPLVASAVAGLLSIQDARGRKEISLQASELRNGSVLYQPYGEQIQMQLSLLSVDQSVATESVMMVLPPGRAPVLNVLSPARVTSPSRPANTAAPTVQQYSGCSKYSGYSAGEEVG